MLEFDVSTLIADHPTMRYVGKILINTDPAQAKASREWQAQRDAKKKARRNAKRDRFEKQVSDALAAGVTVQQVAPGPMRHRSKREEKRSIAFELELARAKIVELERQLAKFQAWNNSTFYDSPAWHKLRYEALKRTGGHCELCNSSKADGVTIQVDHIKPRSKFPELELDPSNLQVLCRPCNMGKSNRDATDWRKE